MKLKEMMESMTSKQKFTLTDVTTGKSIEGDVWLFFHDYFADEIENLPESDVLSFFAVNDVMKISIKSEDEVTENKGKFIQKFGEILHSYAGRTNVVSMEYIQEGYEEFVLITFENGEQKKKCITGDSCLAILNDVYKILC